MFVDTGKRPLRAELAHLGEAPTTLRQAGISRTEILERMAATVDEINALTQRLIDEYRPGDSVYEFLSGRTLDTTVPPHQTQGTSWIQSW